MRKSTKRLKQNIEILFLLLIIVCFIIFIIWFLQDKNKSNEEPATDNKEEIKEPNDKTKINENKCDKNSCSIIEEIKKEEPNTYLNKITYDVNIDKEIENKIIEYMDIYYKSMKELKSYDMTYLFSNEEQGLINQTAVDLLVEIRKLKPNDLTLDSALYDLKIESVKNNGDSITVVVREDNYLRFNFMKDILSRVYNIENDFTFVKINGEYKISKYNKVQDFYVMITDKYKSGGEYSLNKIKNDYLDVVSKKEEKLKIDYQKFLNNEGINIKTCDHTYNRDKAYEYAIKWVNKRNSEWTKYNSNCQNYASQVIYAGGVPMDYYGSASLQWKHYSASLNESEVASGLVYTWTYVPYFYNYVKNNKGYGLCGDVDVNLFYAEAGDVIHVGASGPTRHALVVIGPYKKDGKVVDILVNSNTVDLENYPISAYVYPYKELLKIYGWND